MHRFFGDESAYGLFNSIANIVLYISSLCLFKIKMDKTGSFSKLAVSFYNCRSEKLGKVVLFVLASLESIIMALMINRSTFLNRSFGDLVGTGANYFATLYVAPILLTIISLILLANPIKQLDIYTLLFPIYIAFVRVACFMNGCCWGIAWEHGPYNYHPNHPGNQVPVQAIESGFAMLIFFFLLFYRKKAKPGTMYPMYIILYSGARFFNEFFTANYPAVIGPFKVYHILCVITIVGGLILFILMSKYGQKLSDFFDNKQRKLDAISDKYKQEKQAKFEEEKAKEEAARLERLEKAKAARERAAKHNK
jgi:phosphatidylglycerol:prolipoprotein diacylglycerol transferase